MHSVALSDEYAKGFTLYFYKIPSGGDTILKRTFSPYDDCVDSIKSYSWFRTFILPFFIGFFILLLGSQILAGIILSYVKFEFNGLISPYFVASYFIYLLVAILFSVFVLRIKSRYLGMRVKGMPKELIMGAVFGFVVGTVVTIIVNLLGGVHTTFYFSDINYKFLLTGLLLFIFQSTYEEFLLRSYLMTKLAKKGGNLVALIVSSAAFSLLHIGNNGIDILPVVNIFIAGMVFGLLYMMYGSLWVNGMAHALWNFTLSMVYGSYVSGINIENTLMKAVPVNGQELISGGRFGFEGSIVTTIVGVILIVFMCWRLSKRK